MRETSIVLGVVVASMGLGSLAAKPLLVRPLLAFAVVEGALAVVGGLSVLALYSAYAWLDLYTPALLVASVLIGTLIGAEVPLLMALLQQIRAQDAGGAVADLNAADYLGALAGGLAFPFLLLPAFGQLRGAIVTGGVNLLAAALVVSWLGSRSTPPALPRRSVAVLTALATVGVVVLGGAAARADDFEVTVRQRLYRAPITYAEHSDYQEGPYGCRPPSPGRCASWTRTCSMQPRPSRATSNRSRSSPPPSTGRGSSTTHAGAGRATDPESPRCEAWPGRRAGGLAHDD